jgi:propionyl-CoA synthetase
MLMSGACDAAWRHSEADPESFWLAAADAIEWTVPPQTAFDETSGWFPGASLNTCHNCLDRHVAAGWGREKALIYDSPVTGTVQSWTYTEMLAEVGRVAAMLVRLGLCKGDRVVVYMPMVPQAVFAMLACARIGAIHSVVFGGFAAHELAKRVDDATPKLVLTASCGIEGTRTIAYKPMVDDALAMTTHAVEHVIVLQRDRLTAGLKPERDIDWSVLRDAVAADPVPACTPVAAADPLYILYTSGTTGIPKGVVRDNGGHAVALAWSMANIYGVGQGEVFWAASDIGWVVGHSYIVYAPLLVGATTVLYEGKPVGTPDAGAYWRTIVAHRVKVFFTAPTAIRATRKEDPDAHLLTIIGTGLLTAIFLAGERADPDTVAWLEKHSGLPVIDHWWMTELGWPAIASCFALGDLRRRPGSAGFPVPGYHISIVDQDGCVQAANSSGAVIIREPLPPGAFRALWNNPEAYMRNFARFPGAFETGDIGFFDSDGFVHIMGRSDDIINVAGHRLSTGQMEQIVGAVEGVNECAVIGVDDLVKGMLPLAFVVAHKGVDEAAMPARVVGAVRLELGAVAALRTVYIVPALPKTRSGKILRGLIRKIANRQGWTMPPTIEDAAVPAMIESAISTEATLNAR